jgi:two-component system KDP operon response regulator KdpE
MASMEHKTILIVDDDPDVHAVLKKRFERDGYVCISVFTVEVALTHFARIDPDLVILDIGFPDEDGMEFLRSAQRYLPPGRRMPPVIVLSSLDDDIFIKAALRMGAAGYVMKPYDHELLKYMIEDSLSGDADEDEDGAEDRGEGKRNHA